VERIIDLQEEASEEGPSGYEYTPQHSHSSYIPVSDEQYANSSHTYYAPAQTATTTGSWSEQDPAWSNQYTGQSSSSYDASYYNVSMTQTRSQSYDAGYYGSEYPATYSQQSPWYSATSSDTRTFVPNGTAFNSFDDPSVSSSRRNGDSAYYSHPETDNS